MESTLDLNTTLCSFSNLSRTIRNVSLDEIFANRHVPTWVRIRRVKGGIFPFFFSFLCFLLPYFAPSFASTQYIPTVGKYTPPRFVEEEDDDDDE
jgi:hypothetical protein